MRSHFFRAIRQPLHRIAVSLVLALGAGMGHAVSFDAIEAEMDAIFAQPSFGPAPVDIRFLSEINLGGFPEFAVFDTATDDLRDYAPLVASPKNVAAMFFIDDFVEAGRTSPTVGLAFVSAPDGSRSENISAIDAGFIDAFPGSAAWLIAHELTHNLGLTHTSCGPSGHARCGAMDLLSPVIMPVPGTLLWESQVATILNQPLVQRSPEGLFLDIQPYRVSAAFTTHDTLAPIPLTGAGPFLILALAGGGVVAGRRRRARSA
jgi:hypothetical protein